MTFSLNRLSYGPIGYVIVEQLMNQSKVNVIMTHHWKFGVLASVCMPTLIVHDTLNLQPVGG